GNIPWLEVLLPEAIEAPGGHVAHVERGRSETTNGPSATEHRTEESDELLAPGMHIIGKPGNQQRFSQLGGTGDLEPSSVQASAFPALGGKQLPTGWIVGRADFRASVHLEPQRGTEDRQAMREISGPVERIEHPAIAGCRVAV